MADEIEKEFEAQLEALEHVEDLRREKEELIANRAANYPQVVAISRKEHESNKKQLKSDLKKTTAFVKKIRSINTEGLQQCIRDTETLNLTLYISEIVGAIVETAYKATDVPSMIKLCVHLHRRYDEFTVPLLNGLRVALFTAPGEDDQGPVYRYTLEYLCLRVCKYLHIYKYVHINMLQLIWQFANYFLKVLGNEKESKSDS
jgi:regulator of nonsense transcripts 2